MNMLLLLSLGRSSIATFGEYRTTVEYKIRSSSHFAVNSTIFILTTVVWTIIHLIFLISIIRIVVMKIRLIRKIKVQTFSPLNFTTNCCCASFENQYDTIIVGVTQFKSHVITFGVLWSVSPRWFDQYRYGGLINIAMAVWSVSLWRFDQYRYGGLISITMAVWSLSQKCNNLPFSV